MPCSSRTGIKTIVSGSVAEPGSGIAHILLDDGLAKVLLRDVSRTVSANGTIAANDIQITFFKYGDATGRAHPLTTFYAPVWAKIDGTSKATTVRGAPVSRWSKDQLSNQEYVKVTFWTGQKPRSDIAGLSFIAKLDYTNLLGMDFFVGKKVDTTDLTSPTLLLEKHKATTPASPWPDAPGMYCLGSGSKTLPLPGHGLGLIDEHDSATNASSIATAIIWPTSPPRVSHYFAGDSEYETEESIVKWVGTTKVKNVKASHHGSASSFPVSMFTEWEPDNLVISAGAAHGHPRWELLFYFYYHAVLRSILSAGKDVPQLYSTCYPYWFGKDKTGQYVIPIQVRKGKEFSRISTDAFESDSTENKTYRTALGAVCTALEKGKALGVVYVLTDYFAQPSDWKAQLRYIAATSCANMWRFLSPVTPPYYPACTHMKACFWTGPTLTAKIQKLSLSCVIVESQADGNDIAGSYDWNGRRIGVNGGKLSQQEVQVVWEAFPLAAHWQPGGPSEADTVTVIDIAGDGFLQEPELDPDEDDEGGWVPVTLASQSLEGAMKHLTLSEGEKPPIPPTGYFYCSSRTYTPSTRAGDLTDLQDGFVSRLHMAWIGVEAAPTSPSQEVAVLSTDELYKWLDAVYGIQKFTLQGTASSITEMSLNLGFAGCQLEFSTDATPWVFGLPLAVLPTIPPSTASPVLYSDDMLIFGLAGVTGSTTTTLKAVCNELIVPVPAFLAAGASTIGLELTPVAEQGHRNALWFMPGMDYEPVLRLAFNVSGIDPSTPTDPLNSKLFAALNLVVHSAKIIVRKSGTFTNSSSGKVAIRRQSQLAFSIELALKSGGTTDPTVDATLVYNFDDGTMRIVVECNPLDVLEPYLRWIEGKMGITTDIAKYLKSDWIPTPRRVTLDLAADHSVQGFEIDFELTAPFGQGVIFLFTFSWTSSQQQMTASLWPGPITNTLLPSGMTPNMLPSYEDWDVFQPTLKSAGQSVHLLDLIPGNLSESDLNLPNSINADVLGLSLTLTRTVQSGTGGDQVEIEFYAALGSNTSGNSLAQSSGSTLPQISLESFGLDLRFVLDRSASSTGSTSSSSTSFTLHLNFSICIYARDTTNYEPAILGGSVNYARSNGNSSWQIGAYLDQLKLGNIVSFFEADSQNGVMDLIEHIEIKTLELTYDYDSAGNGSHFVFEGILLMGVMEFDLTFEHWTDHWTFKAHLLAPDTTETVGSVLGYLTSDVVLPSFIGNINLLGQNTGISLEIWKEKLLIDSVEVDYIVFKTDIILDKFSMTFIQYNTAGWKGPKRVFRAAMSGPLDIPKIPVVENFTQPFDDLYFLYVQDKAEQAQSGILRQELPMLNEKLEPGEPPFMFKETHKPNATGAYTGIDTVIDTGLRFSVVATINGQPTVVLDHAFGSTTPPASTSEMTVRRGEAPQEPTTSSDSSMSSFHKTIGPLTISNIGVQYKGGHLIILLDATFKLGPIDLSLLGFGLDLDFTQSGVSLLHPPSAKAAISGLGFGFAQPPVTIAGLFEHKDIPGGGDLFLGGVVVTFEPYLFVAAGCYGILSDGTKTVGLFCLLEGPLVELEFAEITGICGGFGYNTDLKFPTIDTVTSYPLVNHSQLGTDPLDTIEKLLDPVTGCITTKKGTVWLAAGLDVDAFKLLNMSAVVAVEFTASNINLGIFADVRVSFPSPAPPDQSSQAVPAWVYVELGIVATVDFGAGTMLVQGQLAPTSFILDPACHLTGGFALAYWFGSNQHAGDWVFTVGGYHPRFTPPSYYPNAPRLAISWSLDDSLSISGQAYFALTPKVAMGGGELKASLSLSPLYAYFDSYSDFLIKFSPFYFMGDAGIDVGVQFTLDLWICTIHINVDIGAQLFIQGPPIHGYVHVDFWVFGFDIYFGNSGGAPDPVTLKDFYYLLKQAEASKSAGTAPAALAIASKETETQSGPENDFDTIDGAQQLSCVGGLLTSANQDQTTQPTVAWPVRAGAFQFSVTSPFASDSAGVTSGASTLGSGQTIYARPMQNANKLTSVMTITVKRPTEVEEVAAAEVASDVTVSDFRIQKTISQVPVSMWKQCECPFPPLESLSTCRPPFYS